MAAVEGIVKQSKATKPNSDLVDTATTDLPLKIYLYVATQFALPKFLSASRSRLLYTSWYQLNMRLDGSHSKIGLCAEQKVLVLQESKLDPSAVGWYITCSKRNNSIPFLPVMTTYIRQSWRPRFCFAIGVTTNHAVSKNCGSYRKTIDNNRYSHTFSLFL